MKKQLVLLAIFALGLVTTVWAAATAFTVNVKIGSADAETSLVFGQGTATTTEEPFPPYSAQFGVKDVYLANEENFKTLGVTGDMERLGEDIRDTVNSNNQWVIVANSDATLYFVYASGSPSLKVVDSEAATTELSSGASLSVKAGNFYTIYQKEIATAPTRSVTPAASYEPVPLVKNELSDSYTGSAEACDIGASSFSLAISAPNEPVYIYNASAGKYYKDDNSSVTTKPTDGWILSFNIANITGVTYSGENATITTSSSVATVVISAETQKSGYNPITTTVSVGETQKKEIRWRIQSDGTIDYDGNGDVNSNDAMYLYNFVNAGLGEDTTKKTLNKFLYEATDTDVQTALDTMLANLEALDLDNNGDVNSNDAMYLYNYVNAGLGEDTTKKTLNKFLFNATDAEIQTALDNILNYDPTL